MTSNWPKTGRSTFISYATGCSPNNGNSITVNAVIVHIVDTRAALQHSLRWSILGCGIFPKFDYEKKRGWFAFFILVDVPNALFTIWESFFPRRRVY